MVKKVICNYYLINTKIYQKIMTNLKKNSIIKEENKLFLNFILVKAKCTLP